MNRIQNVIRTIMTTGKKKGTVIKEARRLNSRDIIMNLSGMTLHAREMM